MSLERKTILLVTPYWKEEHRWMISGVKLAELWQRLGYRVVVACMGSSTGTETVSDTLRIYRKKDFFLPDPLNFGISFGFSRFLSKIIAEEKPDTIVCNKVLFWSSFAMIWLRIRGHKFLLLTDALVGITWWPRDKLPAYLMAFGAWTMGWLVLLSAKKVVTYHPQPETVLRKLRIAHKTQVIPSGIDPTEYRMHEHTQRTDLRITYVGRLESVKGVDIFLEAVDKLVKQQPFLRVQIVGYYKEGNELVDRYSQRMTFTGLRDDIPAILNDTDIFVLPSFSEGLSNSLMEAMSSGCACIASDVGGNAFLLYGGVSGLLFPAGDVQALRSHIERLIHDYHKREAMGQEARKRIEEHFSWEKIGNKYVQLFETP